MIKIIIFLVLVWVPAFVKAQGRIEYEYDEVGNRICQSCEMPILSKSMSRPSLPVDSEGSGDVDGDVGIRVYPNPTADVLYVVVKKGENHRNVKIMLHNSRGALIMSKEGIESETTDINLGQLPSGTYLLIVLINDKQTTFKVMKQ